MGRHVQFFGQCRDWIIGLHQFNLPQRRYRNHTKAFVGISCRNALQNWRGFGTGQVAQLNIAETRSSYHRLSDRDAVAVKAFGIAFKVDDVTIEKYKTYKIDLDAASGNDRHILPYLEADVESQKA